MDQLISELNSDTILRNISLYQFSFAMFFSLSLNLILAKCYQYFNTSYANPSSTLKSIVFLMGEVRRHWEEAEHLRVQGRGKRYLQQ